MQLSVNTFIHVFCVCASIAIAGNPRQVFPNREALLTPENTINALEKIVQYYTNIIGNTTVDFAFGIRAIEGEVGKILTMADQGLGTLASQNKVLYNRLKKLREACKKAVEDSLPSLKKYHDLYYEKMGFVIQDAWTSHQVDPQFTEQNDIKVFPDKFEPALKEEDSDECMNAMFGHGRYQKCSLNRCWKFMTQPGYISYITTHQILWLLLGVNTGCGKALDRAAVRDGYDGGVDDILKQKCASVVIEMEGMAIDGVKSVVQDIFLEQGFVCGSIGFMDAVRPKWLLIALKWLNPVTGCMDNHEDGDPDQALEELKFWIDIRKKKWLSRRLQFDSTMSDGCSTHKTGVAAGFFATYLRLFFHPAYKEQMLDPYLGGHAVRQTELPADVLFEVVFMVAVVAVGLLFRKRILHLVNFAALRLRSVKPEQGI